MAWRDFNLVPTSMGRQTFILLLAGFILIQASGLAIFAVYYYYRLENPERNEIASKISQLANIANMLPMIEANQVIKSVSNSQVQISLDNKPLPNAPQLIDVYTSRIRRQLLHMPGNDILLSVQLSNGNWLNVKGEFEPQPFLMMTSILLALVVMILTSYLLCVWAIRRLAIPLTNFVTAAKRLSIDVNASPLSEQGPTELREATRAFNEMQRQIRQLITNRTQMLAAISHDLRTPITRLKLRSEFLENKEQQEKFIRDLDEMESMLRATLNFIRDDNEEQVERFAMDALLESLCEDLKETGKPIRLSYPEKRVLFLGRPLALKRAIVNIIDNAVKYGETAEIKLMKRDQFIKIEINDQGPGIPAQELDKVFEPFYRIDRSRSRNTGGTGLGLAIVRDIIRAHNGDIYLQNLVPTGLQVKIILPMLYQARP